MIKTLVLRIWFAINQGTLLICTGQNDFTISGWSYLKSISAENPSSRWRTFVDWLFKRFADQDEHCKKAFLWEWESAMAITRKYNREYKIAYNEVYKKS